jgi:hypothetical protein
MQTNSYGKDLRILRGIKFKKLLNHDFAAAQPLSKSSDQVNGTIVFLYATWANEGTPLLISHFRYNKLNKIQLRTLKDSAEMLILASHLV